MNKTLAGEHTVLAYDQWNQHYHYVLPILILSFYYVVNFMRQNVASVDAPVVGYRSMFEPGWLLGVRFVRGSAPIIRDGYAKFKGSMFKVQRNDAAILVISNKYIDELRNLPDDRISAIGAHIKNLLGRYSATTILLESNLHTRVIREKLTPSLTSTIPFMESELRHAIRTHMPECTGRWVEVPIHDILVRIVARISARVFVGHDLCRNEEWLETSIHFTEDVLMTVLTLRLFPSYLHALIAPVLPSYWRVKSNLQAAKRIISPVIRERAANQSMPNRQGVQHLEKDNDLLQWIMDAARGSEGEPDKLANRQLLITLAAIHTTTMAVSHVIYDLCAHPEYIEPLRREIQSILGDDSQWNKGSLSKLRKLDSFLKESQRWSPPSLLAFNRVVRTPLTLSDGVHLPVGTHFSVASHSILHDPANLPGSTGPEVFDGFRYSRLREETGMSNKFQFVMTDKDNLHFGHGIFACPGRFFAGVQIKLILAHLLLNYDFQYPQGQSRPRNICADENIYPDPKARVLMRKHENIHMDKNGTTV